MCMFIFIYYQLEFLLGLKGDARDKLFININLATFQRRHVGSFCVDNPAKMLLTPISNAIYRPQD